MFSFTPGCENLMCQRIKKYSVSYTAMQKYAYHIEFDNSEKYVDLCEKRKDIIHGCK